MNKYRPFRQLIASVTAFTLLLASLPTVALAQDAGAEAPSKQEPSAAPAKTEATAADDAATDDAVSEETAAEGDAAKEAEKAAPTEEQREAARKAFEGGIEAFDAGDYEKAAGEFKAANEAIPSPHAEYWIAISLDKADPELENPVPIAEAYELFVTNPGAKHVGQEKLAAAVERVKELRKLLPAELIVMTEPAGATVTLNGEAVEGVTPLTIERPAGTYTLEATLEGHTPLSLEVNLEGGITLEQQMNLVVLPPPAPVVTETEPEEEEKEKSMVPAYVTLGLAGAGLITGTIFGILALDAKSSYDKNPTAAKADEVERNALIADMSFGVAITLGVTGVVLLTAKGDDEVARKKRRQVAKRHPKSGQLVVAPYGGPTGGGGIARLTF